MAVSLASIIDEELARKLQQQEEDRAHQILISQYQDEFYDPQYIENQSFTTQTSHNNQALPSAVSLQEEEDFQLALKLQREMEIEERNRSQTGKVTVTNSSFCEYYSQKEKTEKYNLNYNSIQRYVPEDQEEDDPSDQVNPKKERKPYGRKKHDPVLTGRKNVRTTQEEKGIETGDLIDRNDHQNESEILLPNRVTNELKKFSQHNSARHVRYDDQKKERASSEKVMDNKTRILITKMINLGILTKVYGVISTGKEANVYVGFYSLSGLKEYKNSLVRRKKEQKEEPSETETPADSETQDVEKQETDEKVEDQKEETADSIQDDQEEEGEQQQRVNLCCALKIYKTTVSTEFKNREKYMEGEHRFRHRLKHLNPRKLIKQWAEKEYGNLLKILSTSDIRVPVPLLLKKNILLMTFIGDLEQGRNEPTTPVNVEDDNGGRAFFPAPRLNQIVSSLSLKRRFYYYFECILMMRKLYQHCGLVHADLSEYNILVHNHHLYFIDLSQGCEINSSNAHEFLKRDCFQITKFFTNVTSYESPSSSSSSASSSSSSTNQSSHENLESGGESTPQNTAVEKMRFILPLIELFKFITDKSITDAMVGDYLMALHQTLIKKGETQTDRDRDEEKKREVVFMNTRVATKMSEIKGCVVPETEVETQEFNSDSQFLFHQSILGQRTDMSGPTSNVPELLEDDQEEDEDLIDPEDAEDDEDSEDSEDLFDDVQIDARIH